MQIATEIALEFIDVEKSFPMKLSSGWKRSTQKKVLSGLNLKVYRGEIFGFAGLNGAGKTTAIKIAMGLVKPDSGCVEIMGMGCTMIARSLIGFAPERPSFFDYLTAEETLDYSLRLLGLSLDSRTKQNVLELVGLWNERATVAGEFSKGMQRRLALACALAHNPEIYFLDEPTDGLDPAGRRDIHETLKTLKKEGKTVFFSTHIIDDLTKLCDRIGVLDAGRIAFSGSRSEFAGASEESEERFMSLINR